LTKGLFGVKASDTFWKYCYNSVRVRAESKAFPLKEFESDNVKPNEERAIDQIVYGHTENTPSSRVFFCVPNDGILDCASIIVQQWILPKGDAC
jgi:hypothetical protein